MNRKPVIRSSQLEQLIKCGGSRILIPMVAPRRGGEGHEGCQIHWNVAARQITELGAVPPEGGLPPPDVPPGYQLSSFSQWIEEYCFKFVRYGVPDDWSIQVEAFFSYEFERFILTGHIDQLALNPTATEGKGADWKSGYVAVEPAETNAQALGYIVLAKLAYPTLNRMEFAIVQPRNDPDEGFERVSETKAEGAHLEACVSYLEEQVNAALDRSEELNSGLKQCKFCPVGIQCAAIQQEIEFMKIHLTPEMLAKVAREADDALLADVIIATRTTENALKDAKELLHARLDTKTYVESSGGIRITRTVEKGSYTVTDHAQMFAGLRAIIPDTQLAKALNYPVGRIKDAIAVVMQIPKGGKEPITAEKVFAAKFAGCLEQGERRVLVFGGN